MNIDQHVARYQNKKSLSLVDKQLEAQVKEMESKAANIRTLCKSAGWKHVKEYFEKIIDMYKDLLTKVNPDNPLDVIKLQEAAAAREEMIKFIENMAKRDM